MKQKAIVLVGAGVALVAILAGCTTSQSPISRIDQNRAEYEKWPLEVQAAVLDGRADPGMTKRQVEVAKGQPSEVYYRGGDEVWVYTEEEGGSMIPNMGGVSVGVGTSVAGVGVSSSVPVGQRQGSGNYTPPSEVVFRDGVVVSGNNQ